MEDNCFAQSIERLYGVHPGQILHNATAAELYEMAIKYEDGSKITSTGALATLSGKKTGRCPKDKRIVREACTEDIWWGPVNIELAPQTFQINRERAVDYLNTRSRLYIVDGFAGWDPKYRLKIRIICSLAYHALFITNLLIRPTADELKSFGTPDYIIYNAGEFPANRFTTQMSSTTSVCISFEKKEFVILGTKYAGEMKKGVFTIMHYLMPKCGVLSLHSSANEGPDGDVSVFFGLSGTGKTSLSADPKRKLIGDDEHCWTDDGIFNIEGGCYAKAVDLNPKMEPEIFGAIRFGSILENIIMDPITRVVDYTNTTITENTRCAYPIEYIPSSKVPCIGGHPKNIVMLTCDAFGVLPPVSKLTPEQAMYHFISGYTAKIPGTEDGIKIPTCTFSACFGQPFIIWHPALYAKMLAERMKKYNASCYLVNTGWIKGGFGVEGGNRISIKYSRAIVDAINNGELEKAEYETMPVFDLRVPKAVTGVPSEILYPPRAWTNKASFDKTVSDLCDFFIKNFAQYSDKVEANIISAGPVL